MPWFRLTFLIMALAVTSGYRFRCFMACVDQTGVQNDYVEQRDRCRDYAQTKADMVVREAGGPSDDKARKSTLVSLFSKCMADNGWTVPDGKGEGGKKADVAPTAIISQAASAGPPITAPATTKPEDKAALMRASECAFARYSASVSSNAAARAEACDLECEQGLRLAPTAPRPASCRPDHPSKLSRGGEKQ